MIVIVAALPVGLDGIQNVQRLGCSIPHDVVIAPHFCAGVARGFDILRVGSRKRVEGFIFRLPAPGQPPAAYRNDVLLDANVGRRSVQFEIGGKQANLPAGHLLPQPSCHAIHEMPDKTILVVWRVARHTAAILALADARTIG